MAIRRLGGGRGEVSRGGGLAKTPRRCDRRGAGR